MFTFYENSDERRGVAGFSLGYQEVSVLQHSVNRVSPGDDSVGNVLLKLILAASKSLIGELHEDIY